MLEKRKLATTISVSTGTMIRFVLLLVGVFLIWYLRELVLILLTSIIISSFVESALPSFQKIKIGRVLGVVILYLGGILLLGGLFYLFAPLLVTEIYNFATLMSKYAPDVGLINFFQNDLFSGAKDIVAKLHDLSLSSLFNISNAFIANLSGGFIQTLALAFGGIMNVGLIVLISFYLSVQEKGIENFLRIVLPLRHEDYVVDLWGRTSKKIALWVRGQLLLGVIIAVFTYLALSLLGIEYALLLSIIAGMMELIPYGVLVALVPAVAFSYISDGITSALLVTGAYIIIHQFEVFLFAPLVIKSVVGLSPIVIILAAVIGFELGGFWGVLISIPSAVFLVEFMSDIERDKAFTKTHAEPLEEK